MPQSRTLPHAIAATILLLAAALSLIACDDSTSSTALAPIPTNTRAVATPTAADAALRDALLTSDDLGEGWLREPPEGRPTSFDMSLFCGERQPRPPVRVGALYRTDDGRVPLMMQQFIEFDTETAAAGHLQSLRDATASCSEWETTDGIVSTTWKIAVIDPPPGVGVESFAMAATGQLQDTPGPNEAYVYHVRYGSTVMWLVVIYTAPASEQESLHILDLADTRFRKGAAD